ncbi:voltage-gated potassium channel protein [Vibrio sinensis]|uniref:voltage-gated potassium channel protein n=1 Tax=Vibrio sinensis TaxID=2302434 RepID=UPI001FB20459|nr:voltage-gated potassium channel protein [Vibrio sinensis]
MSISSLLWQKWRTFWLTLRHSIVALAVFINGLIILESVWGKSSNLLGLFHIHNFSSINWANIANGPWFLLGIFLMLNAFGLLFRARIAWAVSIILLLISLVFTWHFFPELTHSLIWSVATLISLLLLGKDFDRSSATAGGIFAFISFTVLLFYSSYGALYFGQDFKPAITNLTTSFYFSIVTMTTVGYGDIVPITEPARLFTVSVIIAGITVFATSLTTVFGPLIKGGLNRLVKGNQQQMNRKDHYIVCGTSVLAIATTNQLLVRGLNVTILTVEPEENFPKIQQRIGNKVDIMSGDCTDDSVLKLAGIEHSRALLALTDDDADNAFIVLSARDLFPEVKTVLAVNDAKNMNKVKQVKADVVLSPLLFGSEILASVMSGEPLDNDRLISMLLNSGHGLFDEK